jgi:transposase
MQAICSCGHIHTAEFPCGVNAPVQYGPRAQAAMVHLNQNHAVSVERATVLIKDLFGLSVNQATVIKAGVSLGLVIGCRVVGCRVVVVGQKVVLCSL